LDFRADKLTQQFYDQESTCYAEVRRNAVYHEFLYARHIELLEPLCSGKDVLEIGCGPGLLMEALQPMTRSISGIDISPGMVAKATAKGLHAVVGSATNLPFANEQFDCIYSFLVLPHVSPLEVALGEIARVLRPAGTFAVEFYNRYSFKPRGPAPYEQHHSFGEVLRLFDTPLHVLHTYGIFVLTPAAFFLRVPILGDVLLSAEKKLMRTPLNRFARFIVVIGKKAIDDKIAGGA